MKEIIFDLLSVGKKSNFQSPEVSTPESIINVIITDCVRIDSCMYVSCSGDFNCMLNV